MFRFVEREKANFPVRTMCRVLGVSTSDRAWGLGWVPTRVPVRRKESTRLTSTKYERRFSASSSARRTIRASSWGLVTSGPVVSEDQWARRWSNRRVMRRAERIEGDPSFVRGPHGIDTDFEENSSLTYRQGKSKVRWTVLTSRRCPDG